MTYDPEAAVAEFERKCGQGYSHTGEGFVDRDDGCHDTAAMVSWLRAALSAAHAAGKREAYEKAIEVIDDDCWGEVIRNSIREAARDDGVELG